jgi:hypothetical protein
MDEYTEEPQNVEVTNFNLEWITPENHVSNIKLDDFIDIYSFSKYNNEYLSDRLRYFEAVLFEDTILYEIDGNENSFIEIIKAGTEIIILAKNNSRNNLFYLIKLIDDNNLWNGWIKKDSVPQNINEEIANIPYREKSLKTLLQDVSIKNNIFVNHTSWMGEFIVVKKNGEIICRVPDEEIMKVNEDAVDGSVIGWSTDHSKIWFKCNMDAYVACFGIIDVNTGEYSVFERPPSFGSHQMAINFDNGEIYYTDYRFQFDTETGQATKKSRTIFHLYSYNFFTKEFNEIDTNIGEGFKINFDKNNGFIYEKTDFY